jgi:hypothetical protein
VAYDASQSPYPAAHEATAHLPCEHTGVPRETVQALPHEPQWWESEAVSTHAPEHAVVPAGHSDVQELAAHTWPASHARPHEPQLAGSLAVSTHEPEHSDLPAGQAQEALRHALPPVHSPAHEPQCSAVESEASHPVVALASQSPKPAAHEETRHEPEAHEASALERMHALPHPPQWLALDEVSTQEPAQRDVPGGQGAGVGEGVADGEAEGVGDGEAPGEADDTGVGEGEAVVVAEGAGVGVGDVAFVVKAYTLPLCDPTYTAPPATAGDDCIQFPVWDFHFSLPVTASSAYKLPSVEPTYTTPPATAGDGRTRSPVLNLHLSFPVEASNA